MAVKTMYDFLTTITPDYTTTTLTVEPQEVLNVTGEKDVEIHPTRGRTEERIILCDESRFWVKLVWRSLSETDHGTLFEFYHDPNKACGSGKTFYWDPPGQYDTHIYVVRFACKWESFIQNYKNYGIANLLLAIAGRKADV